MGRKGEVKVDEIPTVDNEDEDAADASAAADEEEEAAAEAADIEEEEADVDAGRSMERGSKPRDTFTLEGILDIFANTGTSRSNYLVQG